jgi:hypothetical protein
VLVLERNSKVVLDVAQALEAAAAAAAAAAGGGGGRDKEVEVAVLYGGLHLKVRAGYGRGLSRILPPPPPWVSNLVTPIRGIDLDTHNAHIHTHTDTHIQDMEEKLVRHLNFTRDVSSSSPSSTDTEGALEWTTAWTMPAYTSTRPALVAALCVALPLLYLGVGAADWSATFGDIAHDIALGALHPEEAEAPPASAALTYEAVREALLYVFRHLALYWGLTRWAVEWERQLFELK